MYQIFTGTDTGFLEKVLHIIRDIKLCYTGACVHSNSDTFTLLKIELCGIQHGTEGEQMAQPMYYMHKPRVSLFALAR